MTEHGEDGRGGAISTGGVGGYGSGGTPNTGGYGGWIGSGGSINPPPPTDYCPPVPPPEKETCWYKGSSPCTYGGSSPCDPTLHVTCDYWTTGGGIWVYQTTTPICNPPPPPAEMCPPTQPIDGSYCNNVGTCEYTGNCIWYSSRCENNAWVSSVEGWCQDAGAPWPD